MFFFVRRYTQVSKHFSKVGSCTDKKKDIESSQIFEDLEAWESQRFTLGWIMYLRSFANNNIIIMLAR